MTASLLRDGVSASPPMFRASSVSTAVFGIALMDPDITKGILEVSNPDNFFFWPNSIKIFNPCRPPPIGSCLSFQFSGIVAGGTFARTAADLNRLETTRWPSKEKSRDDKNTGPSPSLLQWSVSLFSMGEITGALSPSLERPPPPTSPFLKERHHVIVPSCRSNVLISNKSRATTHWIRMALSGFGR